MFSDAYTSIDPRTALPFLKNVNASIEGSPYGPNNIRILQHALPFHAGHSLFEITDLSAHPSRSVSIVQKDGDPNNDVTVLDGTNAPIYSLNAQAPIFLNAANAVIYARFFFHYVRGRFGRFNIIDTVDDIKWKEEPSPAGRKAISKMIVPLSLKEESADGIYHLACSIIFKDSLFESDIQVKENGEVTLSNQEMLVEDLPVIDDSLNQ